MFNYISGGGGIFGGGAYLTPPPAILESIRDIKTNWKAKLFEVKIGRLE